MIPSMVALVSVPSESGIRRRRISVPMIEPLLDGKKYFREVDLPPASGEDLRPQRRPKAGKVLAARPAKSGRRPRSSSRFEDELVRASGEPV
jgi:hypothetical protein